MTTVERQIVRTQLHLIKPKTADHLNADLSNIDELISEYDKLYKLGRELVIIEKRPLAEGLATQATERQFFGLCTTLLRRIVKICEARLASVRGKVYYELLHKEPRDCSDRALNQIVDGNDGVYEITMDVIKVREYYEKFSDLVESYNQRGFALSSLTRAMEAAIADMEINE
jgi:hypothetical protein